MCNNYHDLFSAVKINTAAARYIIKGATFKKITNFIFTDEKIKTIC